MTKEIKLQLSDSLFTFLSKKAKGQGVSIEALCLSLISERESESLSDPVLYKSLSNQDLKEEMQMVMKSSLSSEEKRKRVRNLESEITRFIR